jgi:hypothetical protein
MGLPPFSERLFPLQDDPDFHTGVCPDGTQMLMGPWYWYVLAFFFDPDGNLLREEERQVIPKPARDDQTWDISPQFERKVSKEMARWQKELGFRSATIRVRLFFSEERGVGISDGLDMYEEWPGMSLTDRAENSESREWWIESGCFVFNWGRDYHMSAAGEVEST